MTDGYTPDRRHFLGAVGATLASARLDALGVATGWGAATTVAASSTAIAGVREPPTPLPVKQVDAGLLNVGYVDTGPANGPVVLLLHGWPYDIHSFADVVPILNG